MKWRISERVSLRNERISRADADRQRRTAAEILRRFDHQPGVVLDQSSVRTGSTDSISFFGLEEAYKTTWLEGVDFNDEATAGGTNISPATRTRLGLEAGPDGMEFIAIGSDRPEGGDGMQTETGFWDD